MIIDFLYRSIETDKEEKLTSMNIDDFWIEMDDDFLSTVIDYHRFLSILSIDNFLTLISIDFRYQ